MRIVYLSSSIIPSRTANSIHVMKICQAFADNGHEVVLLAPNRKKEYEAGIKDIYEYYGVRKNFKIRKLPFTYLKGSSFFYGFFIFIYLLFNKKPDLVYGRFLHGCYVSTLLKNQTVFESHDPIYRKQNYEVKLFSKLLSSKYFKKLVVISQALKNMYLESGCLDDNKIQVAHDGADEVLDFESKAELLGEADNLKVGYVGHLYKGKGAEVIAAIAGMVNADVELHVIGGYPDDVKYWKAQIDNSNVFFYGFVPHKDTARYLNSLDVCLLPNQKVVLAHGAKDVSNNISDFTSPLKMFEYMAHNKAIICSDLPVLKEVLNNKNAILVDPENPNEWVEAINKMKNKHARELIAQQAYDDFVNKYTWKQRAKELVGD